MGVSAPEEFHAELQKGDPGCLPLRFARTLRRGLEGKYRIDSLVLAFEQAISRKAARAGDRRLANEERVRLAVEALEREVNNGGYDQFFLNPSASVIVDSQSSFRCEKTAKHHAQRPFGGTCHLGLNRQDNRSCNGRGR